MLLGVFMGRRGGGTRLVPVLPCAILGSVDGPPRQRELRRRIVGPRRAAYGDFLCLSARSKPTVGGEALMKQHIYAPQISYMASTAVS